MAEQGRLSFKQKGDATLEVHLAGAWRLRGGLPSAALVKRELESAPSMRHIGFEAAALTSWDSSVLAFLVEVSALCRIRGIDMDRTSLPSGLRRLLDLAEAVPEKTGARQEAVQTPFLERIGSTAIGCGAS
jgi:phospholipid/cholesterol/gamma-HCH transport system permease protein